RPVLFYDPARSDVDHNIVHVPHNNSRENERELRNHGFNLYTTDSRSNVPASWTTMVAASTRRSVRPRLAILAEKYCGSPPAWGSSVAGSCGKSMSLVMRSKFGS